MSLRQDDSPTESTVRFRKRAGMILCFGAGLYLLVVALGMLRHAGALADGARAYANAPFCPASVPSVPCRLLLPAAVLGAHTIGGETYYRLEPRGKPKVDFHVPTNAALFRELQSRKPVNLEYWRGKVTSLRDTAGNVEKAYGAPDASVQNDAVGASGVLFFALVLFALGLAVSRLPVDLVRGGGPGRYSLPYTVRPTQRWLYLVFAAPALAWLVPAILDAKTQSSFSISRLSTELAGGAAFALFVGAALVLFAAWYLENSIELTHDGLRYRTLFTRRSIKFEEIAGWHVRNRRRSQKVQYIDIYRRGERAPIRLQLDMHWRRSKEIVLDVLRRRAPMRDDGGSRSASG